MKNGSDRRHLMRLRSVFLISAFVLAVAVLAVPFYSVRSNSLPAANPSPSRASSEMNQKLSGSFLRRSLRALAVPLTGAESVVVSPPATRAPGCNNPNLLCLGETVTATVSNAPLRDGFRERRIVWVAPDGSVPQVVDVITDPQTDTYTLPTTGSFAQVGTWEVRTINNRGGGVAITTFEVGDPTQPSTDLAISVTGPTSVTANTNATYTVTITNNGPDTADNVTLFNPVPYNSTFVSASGPEDFPCTTPAPGEVGDINCSSASLALNASAAFTFVFSVNSDVKNGSAVYEWAKTETSTNEPDKSNNIGDIYASSAPPGGGGGTCTLDCPEDVNAVANTTEGGQRGAHVSFPPTTTAGDCGTVTTTPASGDFFPVGNTTVTSTSELNGGSCTFTVTVEDQGTNPPTISCPANKEVNADSSTCFVNVAVGTATATGNNVTIFATRSDGKPMYTCDANGTNCVRRSSDDLFPPGITTITWIAHSHDTAGPYADADDEEAHRTGAASCTQTVTVNDVTPPTITPPANQTASADANCMFTLPDYTSMAAVSDNCACDSNTEDCQGRVTITITQSPTPGTMVGLGTTTITLTANDGSSNNGGAGNTATAHFTVTVNDTTAPVINCPAPITRSNDAGVCGATVNPGTATATDNCDSTPTIVGTRSDNQPLNASYPVGTTTITWTATDDANNHSSCTQTITVNDTELPTISCPSNITLEATCPTGAIATYATPVGMDNCPGAVTTRTAGFASGAVFPIGTTTVRHSVTDAHGNGPVSCSFTVTVQTPQATLQNLINSVNASSLTGTQKNGLLAKLNAALDAINQGKTNVACNKLSDFVNSVQTMISHGDISAAQGNAWISSANHVRNTIGCTNNPCT